MSYKKYIDSKNLEFNINENIIECGNTTWQIKNIAATSVNKNTVPFHEPEPVFSESEPEIEISPKPLFITCAIAALVAYYFSDNLTISGIVAAIVVGVGLYNAAQKYNEKKMAWEGRKYLVQRKWQAWDNMRKNPLVLYSLMLETNAGSKPLFYSTDEDSIQKANSAIKQAMTTKNPSHLNFQIDAINIGAGDSINNFGSSIYQQTIQEIC